MYRTAIEDLKKWKNSQKRKPLVVDGARQVGKTWLIRSFGQSEYKSIAYVNLEKDQLAREIFDGSFEPQRIIARLSLHLNMEIIPGDTLIFIDEAQENPRSITALKYFQEEAPEYHIIVAGSLLGIAIHKGVSFPVGKTNHLYIHPLSFEEFLIATGKSKLAKALKKKDFDTLNPFHDELLELQKVYSIVGGMPEVVQTYINENSLLHVRDIQIDILDDYTRDFSKYADKFTTPKIIEIFNIIPTVLTKENKKFMFGMIKPSARSREYDSALLWLNRAGIVTRVNRLTKIAIPPMAYVDLNAFKLFCVDIGLLGCKAGLPPEAIYDEKKLEEFKGALAEQFVFQELTANEIVPYYYSKDDSRTEIDFVIAKGADIVPIEVKSGTNLNSSSLDRVLEGNSSLNAIKLSALPYRENGRITNMPIYATMCI